MKALAHGFTSDQQKQEFDTVKSNILKAVGAPVFVSPETAKAFCEDICSDDPKRIEKANTFLAKAVCVTDAIRFGYMPDKMKTIVSGPLLTQPTTVITFTSYGDESLLDMEWMRVFRTVPLTESLLASVWEIKNMIVWHDMDSDISSIPESPIVDGIWATYKPQYKGSHVLLSRTLLKKDPFGYLTFIIQGTRYSAELKKTRDAYTQIQAQIVLADAAGYTTAFAGNLRTTVNNAAVTMRTRLSGRAYAMSRQTPLVLMANEVWMGAIEANFVTTNTMMFPVVVSQYNIERAYTLNLASDLGLGGSKAVLILANERSQFGIFDNYSQEQYQKPQNNSLGIISRMSYEFVADATGVQFQIINLA
jgi:hypothetical protein